MAKVAVIKKAESKTTLISDECAGVRRSYEAVSLRETNERSDKEGQIQLSALHHRARSEQ